MAAANLQEAQTEESTAKTQNQTLSQLVRQKEETEADVESLCNLMYQLNKTRLQYESTMDVVKQLNSSMNGVSVVIPLTNSMFVPGEICGASKVIVGAGHDFQMEVDKQTAISYYYNKIERVKSKIGVTQEILATKILDRERLKKAAAEKYLEETKKGYIKALPKFLTS